MKTQEQIEYELYQQKAQEEADQKKAIAATRINLANFPPPIKGRKSGGSKWWQRAPTINAYDVGDLGGDHYPFQSTPNTAPDQWGNSPNINNNWGGLGAQPQYYDKADRAPERFVLVYGFNGMLAQKFSVIEHMTHDEIASRMHSAGDKVPWQIMTYKEFERIDAAFRGTKNEFTQIGFDDAMNIIRAGVEERVDDYVEPEVDEFDDNCVESCKPGEHACGK